MLFAKPETMTCRKYRKLRASPRRWRIIWLVLLGRLDRGRLGDAHPREVDLDGDVAGPVFPNLHGRPDDDRLVVHALGRLERVAPG